MNKRHFALFLAEWSDRWARTVAHDDGPEQLAAAEEDFEVWTVDRGEFDPDDERLSIRDAFSEYAEVVYLDEQARRRQAMRRHPASRTP